MDHDVDFISMSGKIRAMILSHKIAIDATPAQDEHFRKACGVSRFAWNWALDEWNRQYQRGEKPSLKKILPRWNEVRKAEYPWTYEVSKWCSAKAIMDLDDAFRNFFRDTKKPAGTRKSRYPKFKKKGGRDSFYIANNAFTVNGDMLKISNLGWVKLREKLRFNGHVMSLSVVREGGRWFASIAVEVNEDVKHVNAGSFVGVDFGLATAMVISRPLSDGDQKFVNPKAYKIFDKKVRKLQKKISRQEKARVKRGAKKSRRHARRQEQYKKLHYRMHCIRIDAIHKSTSAIAKEFECIVIEKLNAEGMAKNHSISRAVIDAALHERARQLKYKSRRYGGTVVIADRWFPSSKLCSECGHLLSELPLTVREWTCPDCGSRHDRDINAAINLEFVGRGSPKQRSHATVTHKEIAALADTSESVKLRSVNCEPDNSSEVWMPGISGGCSINKALTLGQLAG